MDKYKVAVNILGTIMRRLNNEFNRGDGPSVTTNMGSNSWHLNGLLHREDGPAVLYCNGNIEWWFNGEFLTEEEYYYMVSDG